MHVHGVLFRGGWARGPLTESRCCSVASLFTLHYNNDLLITLIYILLIYVRNVFCKHPD